MQTTGNGASAGGSLVALAQIGEQLRSALGVKHAARDAALAQSRALVRFCANAIRAIHREERAEAQTLLGEAASQRRPCALPSLHSPIFFMPGTHRMD